STIIRRFCQSTKDWERAIAVSRLRTSLATSPGLCAPANSKRRRRLAAVLPMLISISSSARRSAPRASRFFAFRVFFDVTIALAALPAIALATDKHGRLAELAPHLLGL